MVGEAVLSCSTRPDGNNVKSRGQCHVAFCFRPLSLDVDPQKPPFGHHLSNSHRGMLHGLNLHAAHDKVSVYAVQ